MATAVLAAPTEKKEEKNNKKRGLFLDEGISTYPTGIGYASGISLPTYTAGLTPNIDFTHGNSLSTAYSSGYTYGLGGSDIIFDPHHHTELDNIHTLGHHTLDHHTVSHPKIERITGVTLHREVQVPVPVPQPVPVQVNKHVPVPHPVPVKVERPYPVAVPQPVAVPVTHHVPVKVDRPYPVAVPQPVAVRVPQPVAVPVAQPVAVPVTVTKPVTFSVPTFSKVSVPVHVPHITSHVPISSSSPIASAPIYSDAGSTLGIDLGSIVKPGFDSGIFSTGIGHVDHVIGSDALIHDTFDSGYEYATPFRKW